MEKTIKIYSEIGKDIRTRSFFRRDMERLIAINTMGCEAVERIILDFEGVDFISRSVADEICNVIEDYPNVSVSAMESNVRMMYEVVVNSRNKPREYSSERIQVVHLRDMQEMAEYFSAF